MDRVVGRQDRSEFEANRAEAWRRGRRLDAMFASAGTPRSRGVIRGRHAEMNRLDDQRALAVARRLNPVRPYPQG